MKLENFLKKIEDVLCFNSSLVTLIPKFKISNMIKDYRPISCCTIVYKIISKIMDNRLGKVLNNIIHQSQATFMPGHYLQDHILLAYELIKGYNIKGRPHRCMIQMDFQKAYDSVKWSALETIMQDINSLHPSNSSDGFSLLLKPFPTEIVLMVNTRSF